MARGARLIRQERFHFGFFSEATHKIVSLNFLRHTYEEYFFSCIRVENASQRYAGAHLRLELYIDPKPLFTALFIFCAILFAKSPDCTFTFFMILFYKTPI